AIVEGALLRLRPKIMTVSTVVAGLLPIMWSSRVGADVMKPLATPVLGGMISSLLYVLIVTPVLFSWVHERRLGLASSARTDLPTPHQPSVIETGPGNRRWVTIAVVVLIGVAATGWFLRARFTAAAPRAEVAGRVLQTERSGDVVITLSNPSGELRTGGNNFRIEFRS